NMKSRILYYLSAAAAATLLSACTVTFTPENDSSNKQPTQTPNRVVRPTPKPTPSNPDFKSDTVYEYQCEGGRLFVRYPSNDSAEVYDAGDWHTLSRRSNKDGYFRYRDSSYEWLARDDEGELTKNGRNHASD